MNQEPGRNYTPDEDVRVVHYAPGNRPLCGNDSITRVYTDDPAKVQGCDDCSEMVAQDLQDPNTRHGGPSPMLTLRTSWVVNTITSLTDQEVHRDLRFPLADMSST